jgi:protein-tyrosine phosphatase
MNLTGTNAIPNGQNVSGRCETATTMHRWHGPHDRCMLNSSPAAAMARAHALFDPIEEYGEDAVRAALRTPAHRIRPRLHLGNVQAAADAALLAGLGVTHVINLYGPDAECHPKTLEYLTLELEDVEEANISLYLGVACRYIDAALAKSGTSVLVHCAAGVSRSASIVIAYLMWAEGLSHVAALADVRAIRCIVEPNPGFWRQLGGREWTAKCAGRAAARVAGSAGSTSERAAADASGGMGAGKPGGVDSLASRPWGVGAIEPIRSAVEFVALPEHGAEAATVGDPVQVVKGVQRLTRKASAEELGTRNVRAVGAFTASPDSWFKAPQSGRVAG